MKKEDLYESIGGLDDDLLGRSEKKARYRSVRRYASVACLLLAAGLAFAGINFMGHGFSEDGQLDSNLSSEVTPGKVSTNEPFVVVDTLMDNSGGFVEDMLVEAQVPVGNYQAVYEKISSVLAHKLGESRGDKLKGTEGWYYLSGHKDMQYLIQEEKGEDESEDKKYSLWKFQSMQSEEYPFKDVLELVYQVKSEEDFLSVHSRAADMDNTDEGKKLQEEIGALEITDTKDLKALYDILCSLTCYGSDHWEMVDYGSEDGLLNAVKKGRYLTVQTRGGIAIDSLKYTGVSGRFYEYSGIAYNELTVGQRQEVEGILKIS